jgi:hypothetical protein
MDKSTELRVKNPLENTNEYNRRMARDLLTEKDPVKQKTIINEWSNTTKEKVLSKYKK